MSRLENRSAIVTGAGQGIGRAIALAMAREGAAVVIADLNEANAGGVTREIEHLGGKASAVHTDISNEESVQAMVHATLNEHGRVDILVNNAGIFPTSAVEEMQEEEWDRVIGTNLVGTFLCSKAVVPHLLAQRSGTNYQPDLRTRVSGRQAWRPLCRVQGRHYRVFQIARARTRAARNNCQRYLPRHHRHCSAARSSDRGADLCAGTENSFGPHRPARRPSWSGDFFGQRCCRFHHRADDPRQRRRHHVVNYEEVFPTVRYGSRAYSGRTEFIRPYPE